jgi:hypothetical protein
MKLRRKAIAIMILTTTLVFVDTRLTSAQDAPPDLRMLMNLDLFAPSSNGSKGGSEKGAPGTTDAPQSDDSMIDQIRALNAMGYLGSNPRPAGYAGPGNAGGEPALSSSPSEGVEGEQQ